MSGARAGRSEITQALLPRPRSYRAMPGSGAAAGTPVVESIVPSLKPQGYRLEVAEGAIRLEGADTAGLRHGRATLAQLRRLVALGHLGEGGEDGEDGEDGAPGNLPPCVIDDWPDLLVRGVMIDVARDKVPRVSTLLDLIDRLASLKVNQVQLYTEHTFAYRGHEEVWRNADPYTPEDVEALRSHCDGLGVELVANQNTLGHFERWLAHERYRPLALAPDGFDWLFGIRRRATTLDPSKPGSFELVADLLDQLVPNFTSNRVHVGLDEPWELPAERRGEWASWLGRLRGLPVLSGKELLVWGDMPALYPELLEGFPPGTTICEWGYEQNHPFDERCHKLAEAGVPFWVCPGTSSWISITGRVENMLGNLRAGADAAVAHGASGYLTTDWGDMGHLQQAPVAELGFAAGAAMSWCAEANRSIDAGELARLSSFHVFDDPTGQLAAALVDSGQAYQAVKVQVPNMSALALHLLLPQWKVEKGEWGIDTEELDALDAQLARACRRLATARPQRPDGNLLVREVAAGIRTLELASADARLRLAGDGTLASVPASRRAALSARLEEIIDEHEHLWRSRNRVGGLADSRAWLEHLDYCYKTGEADEAWFGPLG